MFDNRGDDVINISNNLVTLFNTYNMNVGITDAENADTWTYAYLAINKVNTFLQSLKVPGKLPVRIMTAMCRKLSLSGLWHTTI